MPLLMVPASFVLVLAACAPCFSAPTYRTFCALVAGWVACRGRRTVTAVALAAGVVGGRGWRHFCAFHRFFGRARWEPDALGQVLFRLALRWIPADQPLFILGDDTLARKHGKAISLGAMHHDPLLSSVRKAFCSFGHVWVVLALWVPLPFGPRGAPKGSALPVLFRLYVGSRPGNRADAPSRATSGKRYAQARAAFPPPERRPTKPELAREAIAVVAGWAAELAPGRTVYVVGDTCADGHENVREVALRDDPGPAFDWQKLMGLARSAKRLLADPSGSLPVVAVEGAHHRPAVVRADGGGAAPDLRALVIACGDVHFLRAGESIQPACGSAPPRPGRVVSVAPSSGAAAI